MKIEYSTKQFRLIHENTTTVLSDEPIGWDKVNIIDKRDTSYWGVNYQYSDGDVSIQFDSLSGVDIIKDLFDTYGGDAVCYLQFGYLNGSTFIEQYKGKLNFYTYKYTEGLVSCTLEKVGLHETIGTRQDVSINLFDSVTLDGASKTVKTPISCKLHSQTIPKRAVYSFNEDDDTYQFEYKEYVYWYENGVYHWGWVTRYYAPYGWIPGHTDYDNYNADWTIPANTSKFFLQMYAPPSDVTQTGEANSPLWYFSTDENLLNWSSPFFTATEPGSYTTKFAGKYLFHIGNGTGETPYDLAVESWMYIYIYDKNDNFKRKISIANKASNSPSVIDRYGLFEGIYGIEFVWNEPFESPEILLEVGDQLFFINEIDVTCAVGLGFNVCYYEDKLKTSATITEIAKTTQLPSTCYGLPIFEAFNSCLESITGTPCLKSSVFGRTDLDYAIDGEFSKFIITNGFFIRNFETTNRELSITLSKLLQLCKIFGLGVGYETDENGVNWFTIEKISYFFNKKNNILNLVDVSDYTEEIAKELIPNTIKVGYSKYPEEGDYILEEFNTQLEFLTPVVYNKQELSLITDIVSSGYAIELTRRDQFADTPSDSTTYDEEVFIIAAVLDTNGWHSESTELFHGDASTMTAWDTSYNFRISPKRLLLYNGDYLASLLLNKSDASIVQCSKYISNGAARIIASTSYGQTLIEKSDVEVGDMLKSGRYLKPIWISCKSRIDIDTLNAVNNAYSLPTSTVNNGFISLPNDSGSQVNGWVFETQYTPAKEQYTIKMLSMFTTIQAGALTGLQNIVYEGDSVTLMAHPLGFGSNAITLVFVINGEEFEITPVSGVYSYTFEVDGPTEVHYYFSTDSEKAVSASLFIYPGQALNVGVITGYSGGIVYEGQSVSLTINPSGGSGVYSYEWFVNGQSYATSKSIQVVVNEYTEVYCTVNGEVSNTVQITPTIIEILSIFDESFDSTFE